MQPAVHPGPRQSPSVYATLTRRTDLRDRPCCRGTRRSRVGGTPETCRGSVRVVAVLRDRHPQDIVLVAYSSLGAVGTAGCALERVGRMRSQATRPGAPSSGGEREGRPPYRRDDRELGRRRSRVATRGSRRSDVATGRRAAVADAALAPPLEAMGGRASCGDPARPPRSCGECVDPRSLPCVVGQSARAHLVTAVATDAPEAARPHGRSGGRCRRGCRPSGSRARQVAAGIVGRVRARRGARGACGDSRRGARSRRDRRGRCRWPSGGWPAGPPRGSRRPCRLARRASPRGARRTAGSSRGMSRADDDGDGRRPVRDRIEPGREARERSAVRGRIPRDRDPAGEVGRERRDGGVRREDEHDLVDALRDRGRGRGGRAGGRRRASSPCRFRSGWTRRRRGRSRRAASRRVGGRGDVRAHALERLWAEHVAGVRPAQDPAPVEVLEQHEDVRGGSCRSRRGTRRG